MGHRLTLQEKELSPRAGTPARARKDKLPEVTFSPKRSLDHVGDESEGYPVSSIEETMPYAHVQTMESAYEGGKFIV